MNSEDNVNLSAVNYSISQPPYSKEAEQALLGYMLKNTSALDEIFLQAHSEQFYNSLHKNIFEAIQKLYSDGIEIDIITANEVLSTTDLYQNNNGKGYLIDLVANTPIGANWMNYINIIKGKSIQRDIIEVTEDYNAKSFQTHAHQARILLDEFENKVYTLSSQHKNNDTQGPKIIEEYLPDVIERIQNVYNSKSQITGLGTGFTDLDKLTSGLQNQDLIVIAGRPSMGKTGFVVNLIENIIIKEKKTALLYSLEMPAISIVNRMLSSLTKIDQQDLNRGQIKDKDWIQINSAINILKDTKLIIDDSQSISPMDIRSSARKIANKYKDLSLIVIDYLQLMQMDAVSNSGSQFNNRVNEISFLSRSLKTLARELNIPIIVLSQLNRNLEARPNKRPTLSDLRDSGAIEQDADLIMFIYRDDYYNPDTEEKNVAELIIGKQRNGPVGTVKLAFNKSFVRFDNLESNYY